MLPMNYGKTTRVLCICVCWVRLIDIPVISLFPRCQMLSFPPKCSFCQNIPTLSKYMLKKKHYISKVPYIPACTCVVRMLLTSSSDYHFLQGF